MIFLYRDGRYKVIDPLASDRKIEKRFTKDKKKIRAVMVECATRLHSDVYAIIEADHFKPRFKPFDLTYTIALYDVDAPIDEGTCLTRTIPIDTIADFYNVTSLIYQLECCDGVGDIMSMGDERITIVALSIHYHKDTITWDPKKEKAIEFINRQGMYCDTDNFLDASVPKERMVEDGCYITRPDPETGTRRMMYYYHEKKNYLYLNNGHWKFFDTLTMRISHYKTVEDGINAYGLCINRTGLVYLAVEEVALNLEETDSCVVELTTGKWYTSENVWLASDEISSHTYEAYNWADILYMGLFLPQIWDINRYLFDVTPTKIGIDFLQRRRYSKSGEYEVPHSAADLGIHADLFAIFTSIMTKPLRSVAFDD